MLSPKRVKHRKVQKGRMRGTALRGSDVSFGDFGLQATTCGWLTARQIEAARIALTRHVKRGGKVWIRVFPDKPVSKKPAETRMGTGKGAPDHWVPVVRSALAGTHSGLGRLLRDRLVGEHADPHLAAALHVAGEGDTGGLDLASGQPAAGGRLQAEVAEGDVGAPKCSAAHPALLDLAVLDSLGGEHRETPGGPSIRRVELRSGAALEERS